MRRFYCNLVPALPPIKAAFYFATVAALLSFAPAQVLGSNAEAPAWMHAAATAPLPPHDEKADAIVVYAENILNVQGNGKIKTIERRAYKILRPGGREYGKLHFFFDGDTKITQMHAWCIPAQGKDFEVRDKDAVESSYGGGSQEELASDVHVKSLTIPASDIGNVVGYEIEHEDRPYVMQDQWEFQSSIPVRESRYTLQLPVGWEYKATFVNHAEIVPTVSGNQFQWVVNDVPAIRHEYEMPPWQAVASQMVVTILPPGGANKGFMSWHDMGTWEGGLVQGRRDASPEIKARVTALTAGELSQLAKMQALAKFVQSDIRYVAIELGIGGWQPHAASDIYAHRFGDCKDKATLLSAMLHEIGVESDYVIVNTQRGGASPERPAMISWFNHAILAVHLPTDLNDPSLKAVVEDPKAGRLLIFDPTDELTAFGQLRGPLQANYGLLVTKEGGQLLQLPQLSPALNGIRRTARLSLNAQGTLSGDFVETRFGDPAKHQRRALKEIGKDTDRLKPIESLVAGSFSSFQITKADILNINFPERPFGYTYSLVAQDYAQAADNMMLVRPRVLGVKSSGLLETKEIRKYPVEFEGPSKDTDLFEITLPAGFVVDDLPAPIDVDYDFASYHSKSESVGNVLRYSRTFEIKQVVVPVEKIDQLKKLYRIIAGDERNTAVLKPSGTQAASAPKN